MYYRDRLGMASNQASTKGWAKTSLAFCSQLTQTIKRKTLAMKIFLEFFTIFSIGFGEGLLICDWYHMKKNQKTQAKATNHA